MISEQAKGRNTHLAHDILVRTFGFHQFRGDQEAIIAHVVAGEMLYH